MEIIDIVNTTLDNYFTNYLYVTKYENLKLVKKFIENENIHQNSDKLLIVNCTIGDIEIIKLLIENGANNTCTRWSSIY